MAEDLDRRMAALESKMQEVETLVNVALRLLAVDKPVSVLLERYGATEAEDRAVHALLDDLVTRVQQGGMYSPSFGGFENELYERMPSVRGNREFVKLLLDMLGIDRPAYQKLHAYITAAGWPQWA
jgi:hypothetical protein